jgi:hypothetical protein
MEKETLEEAALIYASKPRRFGTRTTFIDGAKWQAERMYSEEEVLILLTDLSNDIDSLYHHNFNEKDWFEQFKKK